MDNPHLVAGAAGGDVETLLEQFLVAEGERAALRSVNERDKNDVALVALELRGVSTEEAMELVAETPRNSRATSATSFLSLSLTLRSAARSPSATRNCSSSVSTSPPAAPATRCGLSTLSIPTTISRPMIFAAN